MGCRVGSRLGSDEGCDDGVGDGSSVKTNVESISWNMGTTFPCISIQSVFLWVYSGIPSLTDVGSNTSSHDRELQVCSWRR